MRHVSQQFCLCEKYELYIYRLVITVHPYTVVCPTLFFFINTSTERTCRPVVFVLSVLFILNFNRPQN